MKQEIKNPLQRLQQRKELLVILLFLFVIVIFWLALSIFSSQQASGITSNQRAAAQTLSPVLNTSVIDALEAKRMYSDEELGDFPIMTEFVAGPTGAVEQQTLGTDEVVLPSQLEDQIQTLEENL